MIVEADLNAAELRVVTQLAADGPWQRAFLAGESPHMQTAELLFGSGVAKGSEEYTFAKSFNFRWVYTVPGKVASVDGGQLRTYRVVVEPTMLARATEQLNSAHPAIVEWKRKRIAMLHSTGRTVNAWGRYRNLQWALKAGKSDEGLAWREHAEAVALNYPVQSAIGEIMNDAFVRAWDGLMAPWQGTVWEQLAACRAADPNGRWLSRLIAQCHDALIAHCQRDEVGLVVGVLTHAIEQPVPELGGLLIPAEVKCGSTWGTVEPWKG